MSAAPRYTLEYWNETRLSGRLLLCAMLGSFFSITLPARASDPIVQSNTPAESPTIEPRNFITLAGVTAGWASGVVRWHYNPAGEPPSLHGQVEHLVSAAGAAWSSRCGVHFVYEGLTSALPRTSDGQTVVGWNAGQPYSGITFPKTTGGQLVEAGVEMNPNITNDPEFATEILVHEIGHVLGLNHSNIQGAVMSGPPSTSYSYATRLSEDDISGCQALYEQRRLHVATTTTPSPHRRMHAAADRREDAATNQRVQQSCMDTQPADGPEKQLPMDRHAARSRARPRATRANPAGQGILPGIQ